MNMMYKVVFGKNKIADEIRMKAMKRTMASMLNNGTFLELFNSYYQKEEVLLGKCFPDDISPFIVNEEKKKEFEQVLERCMSEYKFFEFLLYSKDKERMLELLARGLNNNKEIIENILCYCCVRSDGEELLKLLLEKTNLREFKKWDGFVHHSENIACIDLFLQNGGSSSSSSLFAFSSSLLGLDIDQPYDEDNVLSYNLKKDNAELVEILIERGASIDSAVERN